MPTVIINDVAFEANTGERLLDIARRNAAHIGFVCDGNGICQTCACKVLVGAEHLNQPTRAERSWFPESRLQAGQRLACQTALRGPGPVKVLTLVEELRRQLRDVVAPPNGGVSTDYLEPLLENLVRLNVDQLRRYPFNLIETLGRVGPWRFIYPLRKPQQWLDDALRITTHMTSSPRQLRNDNE